LWCSMVINFTYAVVLVCISIRLAKYWLGWAGLGWAGLGWLGWAGLGWAGLGWAGLGWAGLNCAVLRSSVANPALQVVGPVVAKADSDTSNDNSLMGFLSDGASMLVRSTLLQVSKQSHSLLQPVQLLISPSLN